MRLSELPRSYKKLAIKRRDEHFEREGWDIYYNLSVTEKDSIMHLFSWAAAPEPSNFWYDIDHAKSRSELPKLSLEMLEEVGETNPNMEE